MSVNIEEYFKAKYKDRLLVELPSWEGTHLSPATRLLAKRREIAQVEETLQGRRQDFQVKKELLQSRWTALETKEAKLKESLIKFDKFLKENDTKHSRAIKKANDEREMQKQKDLEISRLEDEIQMCESLRDKLQVKMEKYIIYQKYLLKVVQSTDEFTEVHEVLNRYNTLATTHDDLLEQENQNQEAVVQEKAKLMKFKEGKNNEILCYNNHLAELQAKFDKAQADAVKWESVWNHIQNTAAQKTLLLGRIKMAAHNLFQLINRHKKITQEIAVDDTAEQLAVIQSYIEDLTLITQEVKKSEAATAYLYATKASTQNED